MSPLNLSHVWRAHVEPAQAGRPERTAYVEAASERMARQKIAAAIAAIEGFAPAETDHRIYNVKSAGQCMEEGCSTNHHLRIFETGWQGDRVIAWVAQPLFLLARPAPLTRLWCSVPKVNP